MMLGINVVFDKPHRDTPAKLRPESRDDEGSPRIGRDRPLRAKQVAFVQEYLIDKNATQAAIRAGYSAKTAGAIGHENLTKPDIAKAVDAALADQKERLEFRADDVIRQWSAIARFDWNDLVSHRLVCCRYCYSPNGDRQETRSERMARRKAYDVDVKAWLRQSDHGDIAVLPEPFDELAGVLYDRRKPINPDCSECFGEGEGLLVYKDTDKLSADARAAFEGVELGKGGPAPRAASRLRALDSLARHFGLYRDAEAGVGSRW